MSSWRAPFQALVTYVQACLSICLCQSFWCARLVSPRPLGVVPVKATKATFQGWRALRWGRRERGLLPVRTRSVYPSLHSVARDPAWPKRMMDAPRLSPTRHGRQLGCGLKEQYSAFPISCSGLRKDISRSQPASQPTSQLCSGPHPVSVGVHFFVFLFEISQLAADARPPAKLCPSAQACTYRLCRRDF